MTDQKDYQSDSVEASFGVEPSAIEAVPDTTAEFAELLSEDAELQIEIEAVEEAEADPVSDKSNLVRLLIPLLVLLAAGAGYLWLASGAPDSPAPVVQTAKQPIPLPQPPPVTTAVELPTPVAEQSAGAQSEPAVTAAPAKDARPALAAVLDVAVAEAVPAPPAGLTDLKPSVATASAPLPAVPPGLYTVQVGAFRQPESLEEARRIAARTGYPVRVEEARQMTRMTRLLYGRFSAEVATLKLAELPTLAATAAFQVTDGDQSAIYVGSFSQPDKARAYAEALADQGLVVEAESVEVPVPLYKLKLGPFRDRAAAEQAAVDARAGGLSAQVLRKPVP